MEYLEGIWTSFAYFADVNQGPITAIATAVIALTATITVVLTYSLIKENRILRKAGTEPEVVAFLEGHPGHKTVINLIVQNLGRGPARSVKFAFVNEKIFSKHKVRMGNRTDRTPISFLPSGEKIEAFFGLGPELLRDPRLPPFEVEVSYEDLRGREYQKVFTLDVSQFLGLPTLGHPPDHEIAQAAKKIEGYLKRLAYGHQRLLVETITTKERRKEDEEILAEFEKEAERAEQDLSTDRS